MDEVLDPGVVGVANGRVAKLPTHVASEKLAGPVADVERRVGEDEVGLEVGVLVAQEGGVEPPKAGSALRAIRPGGCTVVTWNSVRSLPYGNSPLYYKGRLFTVKPGGFVTAYDAKTGGLIYQDERINAPDDYWSSPVAAAGRVYFASEKGVVTVMDATANTPTILAQNKLDEQILATPALIDQTIVIRTARNLYSFGASK